MSSTASEIDDLIGLPTVVDPDPYRDLNVELYLTDLAQGIYPASEINARHGLTKEQAREFLRRPEVWRRLQAKKTVWESDDNVGERVKTVYRVALFESAPDLAAGLTDKSIPYKERIEASKYMAKIAGLEPAPSANNAGGASGNQFAVNIILPDRTETITVQPVVDTPTSLPVDAEAAE